MHSKSNTLNNTMQGQNLPAGIIPGDFGTELFGIKETRKVFALSNGATIPFENINRVLKAKIYEMMMKDDRAMIDLQHLTVDEALEEFAFCLYGSADGAPDFTPCGTPGKTENFRCSANCRCLKWNSKNITINGNSLTPREITVLNQLNSDKPDKQIAAELDIKVPTLAQHKKNLYEKAGVQSRPGLIEAALNENLI